jgi:Flp pilus assembly protein TadB
MSLEELLVKIVSAVFSVGAILLVLYFINKKALEKAKRMNEELMKREEEQKEIEKANKIKSKKNNKRI